MTIAPLERLRRLLAGSAQNAQHTATLRLPVHTLTLSVDGLGAVPLPIRAPQAKKLISVARPAHFGKGEETVLDTDVRDTWEVPAERVRLGGPSWDAQLADALERMGETLGLPHGARLRPEFHSLLVYGKGQFFAPHQDSEKHDHMVASLVVMLPSTHSGGELATDDVQSGAGHRGHAALPQPCRRGVSAAHGAFRHTCSQPLRPRYTDSAGLPARPRVQPARAHRRAAQGRGRRTGGGAARGVRCGRIRLRTRTRRGAGDLGTQSADHGYRYFDDFDAGGSKADDYELGERLDGSVTLTWWDDAESACPVRLPLCDEEVCAVTPSVVLQPYASEYEGYMGNYGNTVDRWYRRAALVLWPRTHAAATRAEANPAWALGRIRTAIADGELVRARGAAEALAPYVGDLPTDAVPEALSVTAALQDDALASRSLAAFTLEMVSADLAPQLADLAGAHPTAWFRAVLRTWDTGFPWAGRIARSGWCAHSHSCAAVSRTPARTAPPS